MERRVLLAMCTVGKDEAGARELGVSVRTYRRHVADLMQLLGAASRAQAALLARERGGSESGARVERGEDAEPVLDRLGRRQAQVLPEGAPDQLHPAREPVHQARGDGHAGYAA